MAKSRTPQEKAVQKARSDANEKRKLVKGPKPKKVRSPEKTAKKLEIKAAKRKQYQRRQQALDALRRK